MHQRRQTQQNSTFARPVVAMSILAGTLAVLVALLFATASPATTTTIIRACCNTRTRALRRMSPGQDCPAG